MMDYGVQAKTEAEAKVAGPGLEAVAEANVLLSGLGFESDGLCAAHAVGHVFHHIPEYFSKPQFHGELVAFGTLTQLMLEGRKAEFLDKIFGFCRAVGLPTTLEEFTLKNVTDEVPGDRGKRCVRGHTGAVHGRGKQGAQRGGEILRSQRHLQCRESR